MKKVLAVDDDKGMLDLYKFVFTEAGFEIATAEDAVSAMWKFQEFHPDLVILDLSMPAGSGTQVHDRLRNILGSGVPIIFCTGSPEMAIPSLDPKNTALFEKPIDPALLLQTVQRLLSPKKPD